MSFAPNPLIKQGAKLVSGAEEVMEELPTPVRAALVQAERPEAAPRNLLVNASLNGPKSSMNSLAPKNRCLSTISSSAPT